MLLEQQNKKGLFMNRDEQAFLKARDEMARLARAAEQNLARRKEDLRTKGSKL